jgi:hypothetical protein
VTKKKATRKRGREEEMERWSEIGTRRPKGRGGGRVPFLFSLLSSFSSFFLLLLPTQK